MHTENGIPAGTLGAIIKGGKIPDKYKKQLGFYRVTRWRDLSSDDLRFAIENREEL